MLTRLTDRRARRRWARAESEAAMLDPAALQALQSEASRLSKRLNTVLRVAEARLGTETPRPANHAHSTLTDWSWQPDLWCAPAKPSGFVEVASNTRISSDTAVFHDCPHREISLRQMRHHTGFTTTLDVLAFAGRYISLAIDLPAKALDTLNRSHIISLALTCSSERPLESYARLNLHHGPNTDHVVAKLDQASGPQCVEFDLASTRLDETRLNRAWLDLIFEDPAMNRIALNAVSLSRRPRADL